jgi:hypothetical protein
LDRSGVRPSLVASTVALLLAGAVDARADALSDLEKAHSAYVAHKYGDAEKRLRDLLDAKTGTLRDADSIADARMYMAAVLLAEGKKDEAGDMLETLLLDKPDYQPDPLRVSLQAVDALIDARSRLREKLAAMQAEKVRAAEQEKAKVEAVRQKAAMRLAMLETLATEEVVIEKHSRWVALVPFGVGQFQNGHDALGAAFLTGESILALGSIVCAAMTLVREGQANDAFAQTQGTIAQQYGQQAKEWFVAGDLFVGGFALVAAAGVVHAELTFVPEHVEVRKRALPPLALSPLVGPVMGLAGRF